MSTEQAINPELIEETKQQIRGLVNEIAHLARQDIGAQEFYGEFLNRVVSALAAGGGAIWTPGEGGALQLEYQINLRETHLGTNEEELVRHTRLLQKVMRSGEGALVAPHSGEGADDTAGNPTSFLLVLGPVRVEDETKGIIEIFQRPSADIRTQRGYLKFLVQMCELVSDFLRSRQLRQFTDRQTLWNQLESFTRAAHASLHPTETAYTIVNEARRLIGCDRVSVAIRKGRKCYIEAVSGQDILDRRSTVVRLLNDLSTAVVAAGEPVWYSGDTTDMAPQVEEALQNYVDESHAKNVAILPLVRPTPTRGENDEHAPDEPIGALIVEQIEDSRPRDGMVQRVNVVCEHSSAALGNALEHNGLFLLPVWRALGKARWVVSARTLPKTIAVAVAALVAIGALVFLPADFNLQGRGTLQPVVRRDISAGIEGTVLNVLVKHGSKVKAGDVLVELENNTLDGKIADTGGQLKQALEQLKGVLDQLHDANSPRKDPQQRGGNSQDVSKLHAEKSTLDQKVVHLQAQLDLLRKQSDRLKVRSPIDGEITTWDVENILAGRTVRPEHVLLSVSEPTKDWELEVLMPEDRMGHIARAQKALGKDKLDVTYILANNPGERHKGTLAEAHLAAEASPEEGNTVKLHVAINKQDLAELNQGAGVMAKVYCGRRALGFVWLHDVLEFIQSRILFRL